MTPSTVANTLAKHGKIVSEDESEIILEFMQHEVKIAVSQYLRNVEKDFHSQRF